MAPKVDGFAGIHRHCLVTTSVHNMCIANLCLKWNENRFVNLCFM